MDSDAKGLALAPRLCDLPRRRLLGREVAVASRRRARLLGLALLRREEAGPGLLIPRCRGVHTVGMRFALDLFFLDAAGRTIEARRRVGPGRFAWCRAAAAVLEVPSPSAPSAEGGESAPSQALDRHASAAR